MSRFAAAAWPFLARVIRGCKDVFLRCRCFTSQFFVTLVPLVTSRVSNRDQKNLSYWAVPIPMPCNPCKWSAEPFLLFQFKQLAERTVHAQLFAADGQDLFGCFCCLVFVCLVWCHYLTVSSCAAYFQRVWYKRHFQEKWRHWNCTVLLHLSQNKRFYSSLLFFEGSGIVFLLGCNCFFVNKTVVSLFESMEGRLAAFVFGGLVCFLSFGLFGCFL